MAEIITNNNSTKGKKTVRKFLKVDMTPMVDLAFLLITFFIYTTSMAKPVASRLNMPIDGPPIESSDKKTLTILLGSRDEAFVYEGFFDKALKAGSIHRTNYHVQDGIGKMIRAKQSQLNNEKDLLMVMIKASTESNYKNFVDALDEMKINGVKRYAIVDIAGEEKAYLKRQQ